MNEVFEKRVKEYFGDKSDLFMSCMKEPCTQAFFINEAKADPETIFSLIDFPYSESKLSKESYYHSHDNIGKSKTYELGLIYPQEIAASLTSKYVDPTGIHLIVDMCAAPGGKSINILNRAKNDVLLISNDVSHNRASILSSNLERLGFDNVIVTNKKCEDLARQLADQADLVILDAPCSGEGMIRKYPEILDTYSIANIESLAKTQSQLLEEAYQMLKQGGQLVYSTCTFAFEEDEDQITSFLEKHNNMKLVPIEMDSVSKLKGTVKLSFLDHTEGQFFALLKKDGEGNSSHLKEMKTVKDKIVEDFIQENLLLDHYYLYKNNEHYYLSLKPLPDMKGNVLRYGIYLGDLIKKRFEPSHHLYRAISLKGKYRYTYDLDEQQYDDFISGKEIKANLDDHYYQLTYKGIALGYGKCAKGTIKNKYPKGLRRMI
ncbi:MAG: RsmF rRNA methyltransferase first C-terminal domain-containing protein [Erysipelotrichaceae bacterium]|nr:RsmF rRNA methyltransferase first C-terminal domain-containing protein [Erysipelotrichaceae bacterium]